MATDEDVKAMMRRTSRRIEYHEKEIAYWKKFHKEVNRLDRIDMWDKEEEEKFEDMELIFYSEPLPTRIRLRLENR